MTNHYKSCLKKKKTFNASKVTNQSTIGIFLIFSNVLTISHHTYTLQGISFFSLETMIILNYCTLVVHE